jgi:hypothetical protein
VPLKYTHRNTQTGEKTMKATITKSKAGHYHVTVRDADGSIKFFDKFGSLDQARAAAEKAKAAA